MTSRRAATALAMSLPLLLGACGGDDPTSAASASAVRVVGPTEAVELMDMPETVVLDVRTPAEFSAGHVEDARNLDINSSSFRDDLSRLDREARYVVYCPSGNRSAAAVAVMKDQGFVDVVDAGAYADLIAAGASSTT